MSDALVERLAGVLEGHWQSSDPRTHEATCGCYWSSGEHFLADAEGAHEAWVAHLADALAPTVEGLLAAARAEALLEAARGVRNYPPDLDLGDAPARGDWWIRQAVGLWLENRAAHIARTAAQTPATSPEEER